MGSNKWQNFADSLRAVGFEFYGPLNSEEVGECWAVGETMANGVICTFADVVFLPSGEVEIGYLANDPQGGRYWSAGHLFVGDASAFVYDMVVEMAVGHAMSDIFGYGRELKKGEYQATSVAEELFRPAYEVARAFCLVIEAKNGVWSPNREDREEVYKATFRAIGVDYCRRPPRRCPW